MLLQARRKLDDLTKPYGWSTSELLSYLAKSLDELCEQGYILEDATQSIAITGASNISFVATSKTITITGGGFLAAEMHKVSTFTVTGTTLNNSTFTITDVTDETITVNETPVDESNQSAVLTATVATTIIPVTAGTHTYNYSGKIVRIKRAKLSLDPYPLGIIRHDALKFLDEEYPQWETADDNTPWLALIKGFGNNKLRFYPPPLVSDTLYMVANRRVMYHITAADLEVNIPEVGEEYHEDLLDGILHRAYGNQDAEAHDPKKALKHKLLWDAVIEQLKRNILHEEYEEETASPHLGMT